MLKRKLFKIYDSIINPTSNHVDLPMGNPMEGASATRY